MSRLLTLCRSWRVIATCWVLAFTSVAGNVYAACVSTAPATTPSSRFDLSTIEGAALDQSTGLMWARCAVGQTFVSGSCTGLPASINWSASLAVAQSAQDAPPGYGGWRLPNLAELASILELSCESPAINSSIFPATPLSVFWSSTSIDAIDSSMVVDFSSGSTSSQLRTAVGAVRLVRDHNGPVANAGSDLTVNESDAVQLDAGGSSSDVNPITSYNWAMGDTTLGTSSTVEVVLPVGTHRLNLSVMDSQGKIGTDSMQVLVQSQQPQGTRQVYEDAGDAFGDTDTAGWEVYDATPTGATITNVYDSDLGSYVIEFSGAGRDNGYRLGGQDASTGWNNQTETILHWRMRYSEPYQIFVRVDTTVGTRYLYYTQHDVDLAPSWINIHHGLGSGSIDGQWHTYIRDLNQDLQDDEPGATITAINGFLIRGDGRIDDIELRSTDYSPAPPPPLPPTPVNLAAYDLVFSDEFNEGSLDTDKWATAQYWGPFESTNGEEQYYVDTGNADADFGWSPFTFNTDAFNNGIMTIRADTTANTQSPPAQPAPTSSFWGDNPEYQYNEDYSATSVDYLSGLIASHKSFSFTHGYAEARVKVPAGQGLWSAFWLHTFKFVEDVPEIDIMEHLGSPVDEVYQTLHYFDVDNNWALVSTPTHIVNGIDYSADFHTYSVSWEPKQIIFYIDGVETHRVTDAEFLIAKQAMHVILNLAVGGEWPGSPDSSTTFPANFDIDYVRVYQKKPAVPITTEILASDYEIMFEENFSGTALSSDRWNTTYLWGPFWRINNEEQYYVDVFSRDSTSGLNPFTVSNGTLKIRAERVTESELPEQPSATDDIWNTFRWHQYNDQYRQPGGWTPQFTSGVITSYDAFKFVHGYVEASIRVPAGGGLWPAFWLLNGYYVGPMPEIDIMEYNGAEPSVVHHSYHYHNDIGTLVSSAETTTHPTGDSYASDFHTYGVEWHPGQINWYLDGQIVRTLSGVQVSEQLQYIILNLAVGGNFVGPVDPALQWAEMEVDYVRAWQLK